MDNLEKPKKRCIAVDFDSTLAFYTTYSPTLGKPIPEMVRKVKDELANGTNVWIFTARVNPGSHSYEDALSATQAYLDMAEWSQRVFGTLLPITHEKNHLWEEVWDDRGRQVIPNTGVFVTELMESAQ